MKLFYQKIIEKLAAKSHRSCFQLIKNLNGYERKKVQNLNQKEVIYFNQFFATIGENLNKKFRQSECSLKNQQVHQSVFAYNEQQKSASKVIQECKLKYS